MVRPIATLITMLMALLGPVEMASAQTASRVIRLIDQRCANCHRNPDADRPPDVERAPEPATLRRMAPETILQAITTGAMRVHAEGIPDDVKRAMAEYLSGRKLSPVGAGEARSMPNRCATPTPLGDVSGSAGWNGWSPDTTNARFHRAARSRPWQG